jgi:outer membrane protein insertion porin family
LCDEIGDRLTSLLGYSAIFDNTDGIRPTRGQRLVLSQDFAGLGGDTRYVRTRFDATKYFGFGGGWIFSTHAEGGYIHPLQDNPGVGRDAIRITDRFFGPQLRGFDIRGIGPRIERVPYKSDSTLSDEGVQVSDSLGGKAYYMGRLELEAPTNSTLRSLGLRPSAFVDVGSVWNLQKPVLTDVVAYCTNSTTGALTRQILPGDANLDCATGELRTAGFKEFFRGDSIKPRLSIGVGVNWTSPFGPLRIDLAKALLTQKGDDTKLFSFNVGTQF